MGFKGKLGILLVVLGICTIPLVRLGAGEILLISAFLIIFGSSRIIEEFGAGERLRRLFSSSRPGSLGSDRQNSVRIDPLLPVRVLKLAENRAGMLTVSIVAMSLNVGLEECQVALDELVRKGAATVDVDLQTGVSTYRFPEFLPRSSFESEKV